jgi:uncharacterized membrane protein
LPDELLVFLTAMTPIGELRAAIPFGLLMYDLSWPLVFVIAVAGNLAPIPFLLFAMRTVGSRIERRDDLLGRLLRWRTERLQRQWGERIVRYGFAGIVLIVAIPLPLTGAWTGSLAVWTLRVPVARGLAAIAVGVLIAGAIVTLLTHIGLELVAIT